MIEKLQKKFDTQKFARAIEEMVRFRGLDYMEAILVFADENDLEVEAVASLVKRSEPIKQRLEAQCHKAKLLVKGSDASLEGFLG